MQADYPADFQREQGFTERDWLRCLPGAVRDCRLDLSQPGQARVQIGSGQLLLRWQVMAPRQIAMMCMPKLAVHYQFTGWTTMIARASCATLISTQCAAAAEPVSGQRRPSPATRPAG